MESNKLAKHLFEKWAAELRNKDRKWDSVSANFEELFFDMFTNSVEFEHAHEIIKQAVGKHLPNHAQARNTYKFTKDKESITFNEFVANWKQGIEDKAIEAFYSIYKAEPENKEAVAEEKKYGNMSAKEYRLQRRYADSFPTLDTAELEKRMAQGVTDPEEFFKGLDLQKKTGQDDNGN